MCLWNLITVRHIVSTVQGVHGLRTFKLGHAFKPRLEDKYLREPVCVCLRCLVLCVGTRPTARLT